MTFAVTVTVTVTMTVTLTVTMTVTVMVMVTVRFYLRLPVLLAKTKLLQYRKSGSIQDKTR